MENAVEALRIAGSVLLLIIALSVNISTFTKVKTEFEQIISNREEVKFAKDTTSTEENSYVNYLKASGLKYSRKVTIETLVSTVRRLRKENFKVYIVVNNISNFTGKLNGEFDDLIVPLKVDLKYGDKYLARQNDSVILYNLEWAEDKNNENFDKSISIVYNNLKDKNFVEYYGLYKEKNENISDAEKKDIKIITYVEQES